MNFRRKRPWLAVTLSALLPGLGHFYSGFFQKGLLLLSLNFLIAYLNKDLVYKWMERIIAEEEKGTFFAYMIASFLLTVFAMIDAKVGTDALNRKHGNDDS